MHLHPFAVHNPIRDILYVGGGQSTPTALFEVDMNDNITPAANNGANPGVEVVRQKIFCSELNGDIIVIDGQAGEVHKYEYGTGWSGVTGDTFPTAITDAGGFGVAVQIKGKAGKEVFMYVASPGSGGATSPPAYCYLYRYS